MKMSECLELSRAVSADQFGGDWRPQLHFTGESTEKEVALVRSIIAKYERGVVAFCGYSPLPGCYSIELQFGDSLADQKLMLNCRKEYLHSLKLLDQAKNRKAFRASVE